MNINIFNKPVSCDCYLLEYIELSDPLSSVMVRGNGLLMLAAGINKYQFLPIFAVFEKLCKTCMCSS